MNATGRRYDLDWLRVIAFALLMLFHTGMLFSSWTWHVKNLETSDYFDYVMRFLHSWRMPLPLPILPCTRRGWQNHTSPEWGRPWRCWR